MRQLAKHIWDEGSEKAPEYALEPSVHGNHRFFMVAHHYYHCVAKQIQNLSNISLKLESVAFNSPHNAIMSHTVGMEDTVNRCRLAYSLIEPRCFP